MRGYYGSVRLLFLSPRECWPPTSGAKLRDYHFARSLAKGCDLTYVFFGEQDSATELQGEFGADTDVIAVPPPAKYSPGKIVRGLAGRYPLPVLNYTSEEMAGTVSEILARKSFDVVHLDSIHFAAYLSLLRQFLPRAKLVLNWHNIESELMYRFAESTRSFARKMYANHAARQMRRLEAAMLRFCYGHVICSEREGEVLRLRNRKARIAVAPNGVDISYFLPQVETRGRNRLIFVGQMSYHANADGAGWFVREVWPAIRARHSELELSIVGASPGPAVKALANAPGVEVTGTVPDLRPFYSGAYATIVPLLTGGGTRLKILEAMASGTPVISTRLGAEGLPVEHGREILFADTPNSWLDALEVLSNQEHHTALVRQARELVVTQFDWSAIGKELLRVYKEWSLAGA